jgi:hypothetical protein
MWFGYKLLVDGYVNGENNNQNWRKKLDKNYKLLCSYGQPQEKLGEMENLA